MDVAQIGRGGNVVIGRIAAAIGELLFDILPALLLLSLLLAGPARLTITFLLSTCP